MDRLNRLADSKSRPSKTAGYSPDRHKVKVGNLTLGDGKIYIQSMLNCPSNDVAANISQARRLQAAGCDIIRVAVPQKGDARLIFALKENIDTPIVADIHYDYKIALEAVAAGADKIRINPGNIGGVDMIRQIAEACLKAGVAIRVGVNSGSTDTDIVDAALGNIQLLEGFGFTDIVVSVKSSDVRATVDAYRRLHRLCPYPLHLGVTEAGTERAGLVKSAVALGSLICDGIGDTVRVSLTAPPEREVEAAKDILKATGVRKGVDIISCPTCGRTKIDVISLTGRVEELTRNIDRDIKIAVMGCAVNGPGECKGADIGITGGDGEGLIFKKGEIVKKVSEGQLLTALMEEIKEWQN